jgi:hypothetical protein
MWNWVKLVVAYLPPLGHLTQTQLKDFCRIFIICFFFIFVRLEFWETFSNELLCIRPKEIFVKSSVIFLFNAPQITFIKKRSIHKNFMFIWNYARWFHQRKKATLLFKLDIKKASDSVCWDYILEIIQQLGSLLGFKIVSWPFYPPLHHECFLMVSQETQ